MSCIKYCDGNAIYLQPLRRQQWALRWIFCCLTLSHCACNCKCSYKVEYRSIFFLFQPSKQFEANAICTCTTRKCFFPGSLSRRWKYFPCPRVYFFLSAISKWHSITSRYIRCRSYYYGLSIHIMHILVQVYDTRSIFLRQIIRNVWKIF